MTNYSSSRNGLFLIELIISIFFFIISCAVAVQIFAKSYSISQEAVICSNTVLYTQNIAELFLGSGGNFDAVAQAYANVSVRRDTDDSSLLLLFDKDWSCTDNEGLAAYAVYAEGYYRSPFSYIDIYVYEYKALYTENYINKQTVKKYKNNFEFSRQ